MKFTVLDKKHTLDQLIGSVCFYKSRKTILKTQDSPFYRL